MSSPSPADVNRRVLRYGTSIRQPCFGPVRSAAGLSQVAGSNVEEESGRRMVRSNSCPADLILMSSPNTKALRSP